MNGPRLSSGLKILGLNREFFTIQMLPLILLLGFLGKVFRPKVILLGIGPLMIMCEETEFVGLRVWGIFCI